jgi:hypothetical protein
MIHQQIGHSVGQSSPFDSMSVSNYQAPTNAIFGDAIVRYRTLIKQFHNAHAVLPYGSHFSFCGGQHGHSADPESETESAARAGFEIHRIAATLIANRATT